MKSLHHCAIALVLMGLLQVPELDAAASKQEETAFSAGADPFRSGDFRRADTAFGAFVDQFPQSERRAEAVLYQARARYELGRFTGAIELLNQGLSSAGDRAGEYLYRLGMAQLAAGDASVAVQTFSKIDQAAGNADWRLPACIGEAKARMQLGDFAGVADLLGATNGPVHQGLIEKPDAESVVQGQLLLAEALLNLRRFRELDRALDPLSRITLLPDLDWHRLWMQASAQREEGSLTNALATVSNLVVVANATERPRLAAESTLLLGSLLRQLGRANEAMAVYRLNLTNTAPAPARQQALVNLITLQLDGDHFPEATNELQAYAVQFPQESNVCSLVLGDLQLREYARRLAFTNTPASQLTQMLGHAHATLASVSGAVTNVELQGRALLLLGWCFWEEGNWEESAKAFQTAAAKLPASTDQFLARFKLADVRLKRGETTNAAAAYRQLLTDIGQQSEAQKLVEPLLYQLLRACTETSDSEGAHYVMRRLLRDFPLSYRTENGLQWLTRSNPAGARELYDEFAGKFANSTMLAEVKLLVARSYELQDDWRGALKEYDEWLARFGENTNRPTAVYSRALCLWYAGDTTNALTSLTNFVASYPTNALTPLALQRIAEEYLSADRNQLAEQSYRRVFESTNWLVSDATLWARLGAGRAAFAQEGWTRAREYFTNLIEQLTTHSNAPPELKAKAYLLLGDTILEQYFEDRNHPEILWGAAVLAFQFVTDNFSTDRLAAVAWGRIGAAHFQHGNRDTNYLSEATNAWQQVLDLKVNNRPVADLELRSQAEVAIGLALEKLASQRIGKEKEALLDEAQRRYGNVIYYRKNSPEEETPHPLWHTYAALETARLAQERGEPQHAVNVYTDLLREFPWLSKQIELLKAKAIARVRAKPD